MPEYHVAGVTLDLHLSPSLGANLSMRLDAQAGHFRHASLPILDTESLPPNGALVGALELFHFRHWKGSTRDGGPEDSEEVLRLLRNSIMIASRVGLSLA